MEGVAACTGSSSMMSAVGTLLIPDSSRLLSVLPSAAKESGIAACLQDALWQAWC